MTERAVWRAGERLTVKHLTEYAAACERADDQADRLKRAVAVTSRQRQTITRLHAVIKQLKGVRT